MTLPSDTPLPDRCISLFDGLCSLRWLGTNCLLICGGEVRSSETRLLVDPHFSRPGLPALLGKIRPDLRRIRHGLDRLGGAGLDALLITHTHYDHFLDAIDTARLTGAELYGSDSAVRAAQSEPAIKTHRVQTGLACRIGTFTVTFLHARHLVFPGRLVERLHMNDEIEQPLKPPAWFWQYRAGTVYNLLIEVSGHRLYLQGSAGLCDDGVDDGVDDGADDGVDDGVKEGAVIPAAETVVLGIGALGLKKRAYLHRWYDQTITQSGAREVYLSHWDNFFRRWDEHPRDLPGTGRVIRNIRRQAAGKDPIKIMRLPPG